MSYETPEVGTFLPAKPNLTVKNPGPVHNSAGLNEWLQAQAQDSAYHQNEILIEEWQAAVATNSYNASMLGAKSSFGVVVIAAEAGGVAFDI